MLKINRMLLIGALLLSQSASLFAQAQDADFFRSTGKIYAVVGVLLVTLLGIFIYLFYLDRKISKLEKDGGTSIEN